jgi:hypothetical protein
MKLELRMMWISGNICIDLKKKKEERKKKEKKEKGR